MDSRVVVGASCWITSWNKELDKGVITKIGRKYITAKLHGHEIQFDLDDLREVHYTGYARRMFLAEHEYQDMIDLEGLRTEVRRVYSVWNLGLTKDQCERALAIIKEGK